MHFEMHFFFLSFYAKAYSFIYRASIIIVTGNRLGESFIMLTVVTERDALFDAEWRMNGRQPQRRENLNLMS